ncbi:alpha/beta hydrolase family esterase [Terricaulis sp.]|uniref:alpha/beta hydrolase family esterase n=1 Tax=Terricaulis sp. TaxID=2768686 RepID=UPI003784A396
MLKAILAALCAVFCSCGVAYAQPYAPDISMHGMTVDGVSRSYGLYVPPSYNASAPAPLIVALHARFSSAKAFHAMSGLRTLADARGAILLYPETVHGFWNDGGFAALQRVEEPQNDQGFIDAAVSEVRGQYNIDPARLYLIGYDAGAAMAYQQACRADVHYAAVAAIANLMWSYAAEACAAPGLRPTPILVMHGRRDDAFPVNGLERQAPVTADRLSVDATLAALRRLNGCGERADASGRGGSVYYSSCSGAPVAYVGVDSGEHQWFRERAEYRLNHLGVDSAQTIDSFFFDRSAFTLPNASPSGRARAWTVFVPPQYDPATPMPSIIVLHGRPSNAAGMATISQMNEVARRRGFIVIYPEGIDNEWNAQFDLVGRRSRMVGGQRAVLPQDDVQFLKDLMKQLRVDLNIDPRRMYLTGFSNGGFMTIRMACSGTDTFAALAEVSGSLYPEIMPACRSGRAAPFLLMHGTADASVPYTGVFIPDGQGGDPIRIALPTQEVVAFFIRRNGCSMSGETATFPENRTPGTHIIRFTPRGCPADAPIVFWRIEGGGHTWPGVNGLQGLGVTNMDINAGEVIWDFVSQFSLPNDPP